MKMLETRGTPLVLWKVRMHELLRFKGLHNMIQDMHKNTEVAFPQSNVEVFILIDQIDKMKAFIVARNIYA